MNIAIIGAGFTGLSAAHKLIKLGHKVTVFERDSFPGGLALGFKEKEWKWSLEKHYHHWFTSDRHILRLANELDYDVIIKRPKTSVYVDSVLYQLDSPGSVLAFPKLSFSQRVRMAIVLAFLKFNPVWKPFEKIKATQFLLFFMGEKAYKMLWEPLFTSKFGDYSRDISLTWFWSRIRNRTPSLAYPKGGFLDFSNFLTKKIVENKGEVFFETEVINLSTRKNTVILQVKDKSSSVKTVDFDCAIVTLPSFLFQKICPTLPQGYKNKLNRLKGIGATNLVLRLKKPFLTDGTYWLNVCDNNSPVMAVVEHTNFMNKTFYNNENIVYLGNYLPATHPKFNMEASDLLKLYDPFLKKINPDYRRNLIKYHLFKAPFAQSIVSLNYSKLIPPFETPLKNIYLANIQQVYPWDRGTNYAVELGEKVADIVINASKP